MLHAIGKRSPTTTLTESLLACHLRIRTFSEMAIALCQPGHAAARSELAKRVHTYFSQALPLHVEDEDASLAPRLLRALEHRQAPVGAEALRLALQTMTAQHHEHQAQLAALLRGLAMVMATPHDDVCAANLAPVASLLRAEFEAHLQAEETVIFPMIEALLDAPTQTAMLRELVARRSR